MTAAHLNRVQVHGFQTVACLIGLIFVEVANLRIKLSLYRRIHSITPDRLWLAAVTSEFLSFGFGVS